MEKAYSCIRSLIVNDILIFFNKIVFKKTMSLWRELKLLIKPSTHLLEDHVLNQMIVLIVVKLIKQKIILREVIKLVSA